MFLSRFPLLLVLLPLSVVASPHISISQAFAILGLTEIATEKEVKEAYWNIAKTYHPDANPDDASAERIFIEATKAKNAIEEFFRNKELRSPRFTTNTTARQESLQQIKALLKTPPLHLSPHQRIRWVLDCIQSAIYAAGYDKKCNDHITEVIKYIGQEFYTIFNTALTLEEYLEFSFRCSQMAISRLLVTVGGKQKSTFDYEILHKGFLRVWQDRPIELIRALAHFLEQDLSPESMPLLINNAVYLIDQSAGILSQSYFKNPRGMSSVQMSAELLEWMIANGPQEGIRVERAASALIDVLSVQATVTSSALFRTFEDSYAAETLTRFVEPRLKHLGLAAKARKAIRAIPDQGRALDLMWPHLGFFEKCGLLLQKVVR
ncbi:MAG: DnaJ domain-containing protein [Bacteriovoracia bacterium]